MDTRRDRITGTGIPVRGNDIDTDRIIPARFLKCVTFDALGPQSFFDERFGPDGNVLGHPFDDPRYAGGAILICGFNFGCGSSREHAPQALHRFGVTAIVGGSFAEIFFANALAIGLPCVTLDAGALEELTTLVESAPKTPLEVRSDGQVSAGSRTWRGTIPDAAADALREGCWDPLGELLAAAPQTRTVAGRLPYLAWDRV